MTAVYTYPVMLSPRSILRGGRGHYLTETSMVTWSVRQTVGEPERLLRVPPVSDPYSNGVA